MGAIDVSGGRGTANALDVGTSAGQIPVCPIPMAAMPTVKPVIDAINASGGISGAIDRTPNSDVSMKGDYSLVISQHYDIPAGLGVELQPGATLEIT